MYGKRGGRVQVTTLQFQELVNRVEKLEQSMSGDAGMTKKEVIDSLDELGIKYNPRDKKDVLIDLLESHKEE